MPTYEYRCQDCQYELEEFQKITDSPLTTCPNCGKKSLRRGPGGGIGLSFQGSGFYITDYAKSQKADSDSPSSTKASCGSDCKGNCS